MGPTPVADKEDMKLRGLVGTLVRDGVVRAFHAYIDSSFVVFLDEAGHEIRRERFSPLKNYERRRVRYEDVSGVGLLPFEGTYFTDDSKGEYALVLESADARALYHLEFWSEAGPIEVDRVQSLRHVCTLDKIVKSRWEPQKITALNDRETGLALPDDLIEAHLEVQYAEQSTDKTGRFQVLGVERSIAVYGAIDPVFKALIDRVIASDR